MSIPAFVALASFAGPVFNPGVPAAQRLLFPDPQPLVERLGRDFFHALPDGPGVYLMHGPADGVLYVGKAKNLRHRLASYRVANPDRMARRTLRLLRLVERIAWETCADEKAALRRESELLRALKPRFNRAGVWAGPRRFLAWRGTSNGLELTVTEARVDGSSHAGPFGAQARHLLRALARLVWCRFHPEAGLAGLPVGWLRGQPPTTVVVPHCDKALVTEASGCLCAVAGGDREALARWLLPVRFPFEQPLRDEDLEFVTQHLAGQWNEAAPEAGVV